MKTEGAKLVENVKKEELIKERYRDENGFYVSVINREVLFDKESKTPEDRLRKSIKLYLQVIKKKSW